MSSARERLVGTTIELMRRHGIAGTGLTEILKDSGISRRTIYLHFPDGKAELAAEATRVAGSAFSSFIRGVEGSPLQALRAFSELWAEELRSRDFAAGCPIVSATLGRAASPRASAVASEVFAEWQGILTDRLTDAGVSVEAAQPLATTMVAAIEGAVLLAIAEGSTRPLEVTTESLATLLQHHTPAAPSAE